MASDVNETIPLPGGTNVADVADEASVSNVAGPVVAEIGENGVASTAQDASSALNVLDVHDDNAFEPAPVLDRTSLARVDKLLRDASVLQGKREALVAREAELIATVGRHKGTLALKNEMEGALESLQRMAHERSVGSFERMLTAIARDVQPQTQTSIRLDLTTERNMPALDIFAEVAGKREGVTSGALTNLLSTGLRFITLARSGRARFMLLDEADCFIEGGDVQNFFNVIDQLSRDAGIQTVCITHHDMTAFEERFRIYKIAEVDSHDAWPRRIPELVSPGKMQSSSLQDGYFSFIEAENFESYTTGHIELSPGVTVITGKNGRGKSAWARMLRGAFLGESSDDNVRHGKTATSVSVGFSDGRVLSHHRRIKGTPKGEYILHTPDSYEFAKANPATWKKTEGAPRPLHHTETARLPEWVPLETGVAPVDGINVAMWNQLTPVFMLDQPASKRASLLSIGRESGHLYAMNEVYKDDVRTATTVVRDGEKEIGAIRVLSAELAPLAVILPQLEEAKVTLEALMAETDTLKAGGDLITQLAAQHEQLDALRGWNDIASRLGEPPEVERTEGLAAWFERLQQAQEAIALKTDLVVPEPPALAGEEPIAQLLNQMESAQQDAALLGKMPGIPQQPELVATAVGQDILLGMAQALHDSRLPRLQRADAPDIQATQSMADWIDEMAAARAQSALPIMVMPEITKVQTTQDLLGLIDDMARSQTVANGCKAQAETLMLEARQLDNAVERASEVLGAQWDLPADRITRLAEQITQSVNNTPGSQTRIVCQLDALERQLGLVAKEGFAHGLMEGLTRTAVISPRPLAGLDELSSADGAESRKLTA